MAVRDIGSLLVGLLLLFHTWGVWAAVVVNMEDRVEVVKGEMAQITCMFTSDDGIGGMTLKWYYLARSGEKREIFHQDPTVKTITRDTPFTNRISVNVTVATGTVVLTINDVQLQDELDFICSIDSLTDGRDEGRTKLKVFKTPDFPTIEAAQLKHLVTDENLSKIGTCEVKNGFPKPNVTWYRNNTPLLISENVKVVYSTTSESSQLISVSSDLLKKVVKEDKDAEFYCEVKYFVPGAIEMMETQRINITVLYPSTTVNMWVQSPQGQIKEGDSVRIQCIGNGNIPATVKIETPQGISKEGSVLELDNVIRQNSGVYVCSSEDMEVFHEATGNMTLTVNYLDSAVVMPKDDVVMNQTDDLEATCNALSSLKTNTIWFKNGEVVAQGHILKLEAITFNASGTYTCVVTVPEIEGMKTTGTLRVNVNSAPEIVMPRKTEMREESLETTVELTCLARGFPPPSITWSTSDGKMLLTATSEETEHGVKSVVTVKVTSDITAFCNSVNEHGEESATFVITATSHTTQAKTTTTTTPTTTTTTTSSTSLASATEGSGVIIAVIIICILLLAVLGSVLYFLYKKGKICGRSGKQDLTKEKSNKDNIVVEMKSDNTEEAILLGVNGEKQLPSDQSDEYLDVQK